MARPLGPTIEIAASNDLLARLERELANATGKVAKGALRALRRSLASGKSAASTEIRDVINLKKKPVDARIKTKVISERLLIGAVTVRDRRIPLIEFLTPAQIATAYRRQQPIPKAAKSRATRSEGVRVKVYKDKASEVYKGAFVAIGNTKYRWHVLKRKGKERYPVFIQYGPNLTQDFEKKLPAFAARAAAVLEKNLEREFDAALRGF